MNSVVMFYPDWVIFDCICKRFCFFFSAFRYTLEQVCSIAVSIARIQKQFVSTWCYETMGLYLLIHIEHEEAKPSNIVQYFHELNFEKNSIEKSVEGAVAYEKLFEKLNFSEVIKIVFCEHRQKNILR